jgi:hypothetical protein
MYDWHIIPDMTPSETPPKSKGFDEIVLWIVVGLYLALAIAWLTYPRIYLHSHPELPWPVIPGHWKKFADSSPTLVYFFFACITAFFGLWQTRFHRRFGRDSSTILLRFYLLFSVTAVAGSWTFDLGSHFWTIPIQSGLYAPDRVLQIGRRLVEVGVFSALGAAFLNVTYSSFRERRT